MRFLPVAIAGALIPVLAAARFRPASAADPVSLEFIATALVNLDKSL